MSRIGLGQLGQCGGELHTFGAMIGLLETEEGRRTCDPHSKLQPAAPSKPPNLLEAFLSANAPQRHWRSCEQPAHPSCLSACGRLAFQHDTNDVCSHSSRARPSCPGQACEPREPLPHSWLQDG
jgi:hypothetical protein